jgi:cell wall-associated NlpC family hydrolase
MEKHELIHKLRIAEKVAWSFHGLPYIWGGDDPIHGFDCSGFIIEILKSVGILPRNGDWTAQDLWDIFKDRPRNEAHAGCLAFWWNQTRTRIIHVEYCLDNERTIGASGGGSRTKNKEDASRQNAYIKIRPVRIKNIAGYLDPFR